MNFRLSNSIVTGTLIASGWGANAQILINEIYYDPEPDTAALEFIELYNSGSTNVDASGWHFSDGVEYTFPAGTIIPSKDYLVIAENPASVNSTYGTDALGPWNGSLSNEGEKIVLRDAKGDKVDTLDYQRGFPWPVCPDGASMELMHPSLDNDLGGSWRSSSFSQMTDTVVFIEASTVDWRYFKGTSEPSFPSTEWRAVSFHDSGWLSGQASIGYGDDDDNTTLSDMRFNYSSVYLRKSFEVEADEIPSTLLLRLYVDDGAVVWINGTEVARVHVPDGELAYNDTASGHEASWEEIIVPGDVLNAGTNIVAVHGLNSTLRSNDFSIDLELRSSAGGDSLSPSPGALNRSWAGSVPPASRQIKHIPEQPKSGELVVITTKVTDPDGVDSVLLEYQQVAPGAYLRAIDAAYESNWTKMTMTDDGNGADSLAGDDIYTATIPSNVQVHRHLIRYRITVTDTVGATQTVPYADDNSRNFAYFVYDGVPDWTGADQPGITPATTFPTNVMANALPVYHLIASETDVIRCQYTSAYRDTRFYGTLIYDNVVYDHIQFKVRGEASTYQSGKNKWRIYFNTAYELEGRDNYGKKRENKTRKLNLNACASPWIPVNRGMAGLDEATSYRMYELAGALSPQTHYLQFRVIDDADEAPADQYAGDLWGLYLSVEHIDGRFLKERDLPDGNTYKIQRGAGEKRNQSPVQSEDNSDWNSFYSAVTSGSQPVEWWRNNFDLHSYYSFRGINRVLSNIDLRDDTNYGMYHHTNDCWHVIPQDLDMMFAPETHWPGTVAMKSCLNHAELEMEFKNRCRELLDLLFSDSTAYGGQSVQVLHELAQWVNPTGEPLTFADVDQFMWNYHPRTASGSGQRDHRGNFYATPKDDTRQGGTWTRTLESPDFEGFVQYITDFITNTDPDGFAVGDGDQRGYGFNYLQLECADSDIPYTPIISYTGPEGYPADSLQFSASPFNDPQGTHTFGAVQWRIGRIRNPSTPDYDAGERWIYEIDTVWDSGELTGQETSIAPPIDLSSGHTYRTRVRYKDNSGRWSHWSHPVHFVTGAPVPKILILSEVHYNPTEPGSGADNDDFEFVELRNLGAEPLDLRGYAFNDGIEFTFRGSQIEMLPPGGYVVVARDLEAFASRYDINGMHLAGPYSGKLSNSGENIRLEFYGKKQFDISYSDARGWPKAADGGGPSLVPISLTTGTFDHPDYWRSSTYIHGSPGEADPEPANELLINEVIAHTDTGEAPPYDSNDKIELFNPSDSPAVLDGNWYLSDDFNEPERWNIPAGTTVPARGWIVFDEDDFHSDRVTGFGLDKAGEQLLLSHMPNPNSYRIVDSLEFEGQANGSSWGRYPDGDAFFQTLEPTAGSSNRLAEVGIRFEQVMFHPAPINGTGMDSIIEYILITNCSTHRIELEDTEDDSGTWRLSGGVDYTFEPGTSLTAGERLWLVPFNPQSDPASKALFCSTYGLDSESIRLMGPYDGQLSNNGERISLERPQASDDPLTPEDISWIIVDEVYWAVEQPWPDRADTGGIALIRTGNCGNDPNSWTSSDDLDTDGIPDLWELSYRPSLHDLGTGDFDGDQSDDLSEYLAGTIPTNPSSVFKITAMNFESQCVLSWNSETGKVYTLWISPDLTGGIFTPVISSLPSTPPVNTTTSSLPESGTLYFKITAGDLQEP